MLFWGVTPTDNGQSGHFCVDLMDDSWIVGAKVLYTSEGLGCIRVG